MKEYKKNEVKRDMFYEEQKREKQTGANTKLRDEIRQEMEETKKSLEKEDPWIQRKNEETAETTETTETPEIAETVETAETVNEDDSESGIKNI